MPRASCANLTVILTGLLFALPELSVAADKAIFDAVADDVKAGRTGYTAMAGDPSSGNGYSDEAPNGGILIGVKVSTGKFGSGYQYKAVSSIQPIYKSAGGRALGRVHGPELADKREIVAREGYAVGAIRVNPEDRVKGIQLVFMKINASGQLDIKNSYVSSSYLDTPASAVTLGGNGAPIVGIKGVFTKQEQRALALLQTKSSSSGDTVKTEPKVAKPEPPKVESVGEKNSPRPSAIGDRRALVIGNSKYEGASALKNPANDADAVDAALKKLGFHVTKKVNVELADLEKVVVEFRRSLKKGDAALFFYAGHGMQVKGENYLMPINTRIDEEFEVKRKCYGVDQILAAMDESECALKVMILDCCRDNPLTRSWKRSSSAKGIAAITDIPEGTVIAFATAPGKTAEDGRGTNSPYTAHLVASLNARPKEGLELTEALKEASRAVKKETGQIPWINQEASLDKFYLWRSGTDK